MDFIVGTFNHSVLYTLHFSPPGHTQTNATINLIRDNPAIGGHSWLALSRSKEFLYCTVWHKTSPSVAAYKIKHSGREIQFINAKHVKNMSGYVCVSDTHIYSVGGASGEVFTIGPDGGVGELIQELDFVTNEANVSENRGAVPHGDFGGLRHGAHSCDLSINGKNLYVADIGRNCIWTYKINARYGPAGRDLQLGSWTHDVDHSSSQANKATKEVQHLELGTKHISPRAHDGPRHTWPHPNGTVLYSLQEHSSMVDVFTIASDGVTLTHVQGVRIIPSEKDCTAYWADEVRLSTGPDAALPRFLYASTRGLRSETKGYLAAFALSADGRVTSEEALDIWETPSSGGIANAIEPAPWRGEYGGAEGVDYLAMTDSEQGLVSILGFDGKKVQEMARMSLGETDEGGVVVGAATAVWL